MCVSHLLAKPYLCWDPKNGLWVSKVLLNYFLPLSNVVTLNKPLLLVFLFVCFNGLLRLDGPTGSIWNIMAQALTLSNSNSNPKQPVQNKSTEHQPNRKRSEPRTNSSASTHTGDARWLGTRGPCCYQIQSGYLLW